MKLFNRIDIYCKKGKCPICNGKVTKKDINDVIYCPNGCYMYIPRRHINGDVIKKFYIFNEEQIWFFSDSWINWQPKKELISQIKYWKENERYLLMILTEA